MDCKDCEKLKVLEDKLEDMRDEVGRSAQDAFSALYLVARIREALGDNGLRMQDELIGYCKHLAELEKKQR